LAYGHRSDAGHDRALGQMPVTHDTLVARLGLEIGISPQEVSDFRLNGLREQSARPVAQDIGERIGERPWLSQLDDISVGHGVSFLWWRSGGVEHPHDTPPYPFMPSPTSAHSSRQRGTDQTRRRLRSAEQKMKSNSTRPEMEQAGEQSAVAGTP
jgi:hypothetical protein